MNNDERIKHLCSIIAGLRKDIEMYERFRKEDAARLKEFREDAAFGHKCRFHVEAMAELRGRDAPGWLDMCKPILVSMLNSVSPPQGRDEGGRS